jgi:hypothetical protein
LINKIKSLPYLSLILKVITVLLLCLPLLFINIRNDIDWGDDNAHYLLQAKYITEGTPQANTQYIYNSDCPVLGPPAYPIGFPLILSGVYYFKGLNLHAFSLMLAIALIAVCLLLVLYYNNKFRFLTSVFLILIIAYNPWTLGFKSEIMSEIPFTFCLILIVILYEKFKNIYSTVFIGLLCGYLISIRTIGVVMPLAILAETIKNIIVSLVRKEKALSNIIKLDSLKLLLIFLLSFGVYFLLNKIIFKIPSDAANGYLSIFRFHNLDKTLLQNLAYYTEIFESFFYPKNKEWVFLPLITKSFMLTMVLLGFIKKSIRKFTLTDFLVVFYLVVILIYPYGRSGFRFLFPLLPFLMNYVVIGLKSIHLGIKIKTPAKVILLGILLLIQYKYGIDEMNKVRNIKQEGPCSDDSWLVFDFIKNRTPKNAVIAFIKPRALALFTNRKCIANNISQFGMNPMEQKFEEAGVDYYLLYCRKQNEEWSILLDEMMNLPLEKYIESTPSEISLFWSNERFKLYKRVKLR